MATNKPYRLYFSGNNMYAPYNLYMTPGALGFDTPEQFDAFLAKMPLSDPIWMLVKLEDMKPVRMSSVAQTILAAANELYGIDVCAHFSEMHQLATKVGEMAPIDVEDTEGRRWAIKPKACYLELSFPSNYQLHPSFIAVHINMSGRKLEDIFFSEQELAKMPVRSRLYKIAAGYADSHGKSLAEGLAEKLKAFRKKNEELLKQVKTPDSNVERGSIAWAPLLLSCIDRDSSGYATKRLYYSNDPQTGARKIAIKPEAEPTSQLDAPLVEMIGKSLDYYSFGPADIKKAITTAGTVKEALQDICDAYNSGKLACAPPLYGKSCCVRLVDPKNRHYTMSCISCTQDADIEGAMEIAGVKFWRADDGVRASVAVKDQEKAEAQTPGSNEWLMNAYTELAATSAQTHLSFGDEKITLGLQAYRMNNCESPVLRFTVEDAKRNNSTSFPVNSDFDAMAVIENLYKSVRNYSTVYRNWMEDHPENEPRFLEEAIQARIDNCRQTWNDLLDRVARESGVDIEAFYTQVLEVGEGSTEKAEISMHRKAFQLIHFDTKLLERFTGTCGTAACDCCAPGRLRCVGNNEAIVEDNGNKVLLTLATDGDTVTLTATRYQEAEKAQQNA